MSEDVENQDEDDEERKMERRDGEREDLVREANVGEGRFLECLRLERPKEGVLKGFSNLVLAEGNVLGPKGGC